MGRFPYITISRNGVIPFFYTALFVVFQRRQSFIFFYQGYQGTYFLFSCCTPPYKHFTFGVMEGYHGQIFCLALDLIWCHGIGYHYGQIFCLVLHTWSCTTRIFIGWIIQQQIDLASRSPNFFSLRIGGRMYHHLLAILPFLIWLVDLFIGSTDVLHCIHIFFNHLIIFMDGGKIKKVLRVVYHYNGVPWCTSQLFPFILFKGKKLQNVLWYHPS